MKGRRFTKRSLIGVVAAACVGIPALTAAVQRDGELNVITTYYTLDALTWDVHRWPWKANHDHLGLETLQRGDLSFGPRGKGEFSFNFPDHIPSWATEGELAESWEEHPDRLVFKLREGVEWMEIPGVMERRALRASDVTNHFKVMKQSARYIPGYWDYVDRFEANDEENTVTFHLSDFHANWAYRMGWGFWSGILPPEWHELSDEQRADWRNAPGTGPYRVADVQRGRHKVYQANPNHWGSETIDGEEHQLPLNKSVTYQITRDESAAVAAFTSGRADIYEAVRWQFIDQIRRAHPDIRTLEVLAPSGTYIALRNDRPPFDDVRVRRAMNLAVDQKQILESVLNGRGELNNYPLGPGFAEYHEPLEQLPAEAQELFSYNIEKARELLAEAGYPDGFQVDMMVTSANPYHQDLVAMLQAYYERIGVRVRVNTLEYPVYVSQMRRDTMAPMYLMDNSSGNPISAMRKTFQCGQHWNASMHCDEEFDREMMVIKRETDPEKRLEMMRELNRYVMAERVPHVWLPSQVTYVAWWPWVKNYAGETRIGAMKPNAIYSRIWIDEDEKRRTLRRR